MVKLKRQVKITFITQYLLPQKDERHPQEFNAYYLKTGENKLITSYSLIVLTSILSFINFDKIKGCYQMNKILLSPFVLLVSITQAQTFEWVDVVPLELQTNPSFLHGTVAMDNSGNPVCA